jgi:hypothetical protein
MSEQPAASPATRFEPLWRVEIKRAKAAAFAALSDDEKERARADQAAWRVRRNRDKRDREQRRRGRFKRLLELYFDARTVDEIALEIGLTAPYVRQLATMLGVPLTRGPSERRDPASQALMRAVAINRLQEKALRRLASDAKQEPAAALADLVSMALESDAQVARRLLRVARRA